MKLAILMPWLLLGLGRSTLSEASLLHAYNDIPGLSDLGRIFSLAGSESVPGVPPSRPSKASSYSPPPAHDFHRYKRQTQTTPADVRPTPEPTGASSASTTVHIIDEHDFALLMPDRAGELISDAESDGVAYCMPDSTDPACSRRVAEGFITGSAVTTANDGSYIQVTGCLDVSKSSLDPSDTGGQFDVRFPNGAQCSFGGYGASFIQLVEPAANRFCLRCCSSRDDQVNCNSHQDRAGCQTAIPGTYDFPSLGVTCSE
ncbi:hypothetical protein C8Q78DRAFT_1054612 [Trametes maxima]|nr:hypothetical protein C8Q78DRAFT_1054612 [Trametes maxima]